MNSMDNSVREEILSAEVLWVTLANFWDYIDKNQIAHRNEYSEQEQLEVFAGFLSEHKQQNE